jgi:branched-chain amino acid transport system permease protein
MIILVQGLVGGIALGGTYALIALGLVLAFRATRTFNFAHGELMLLPAFLTAFLQARNFGFLPSVGLSILLSAAIGAAMYILVLRRTTGLPVFMGIIATFGLAAILDGIMGILFTAPQYSITTSFISKGSFTILNVHVGITPVLLGVFSILLAVLTAVIIRTTHLGLMVRAAGQDPVLAAQSGMQVRRLYMASWAVAAMLAAVAGITYGSVAEVSTSMIGLGLAAIPAIVLGGLDSIAGAIIGGIFIGLVQSFTQIYLGGYYVDLVTYTILLVVLLIYPQGLFGTKQVVRA